MFPEKVFTIEEISQHLRVPEDAVRQEIAARRLRALLVGGLDRILESDYNAYLKTSFEGEVAERAALTTVVPLAKQTAFDLRPAGPFDHTWPSKKGAAKTTERFTDGYEGIVPDGGRERHVKLGFTSRSSAGKRRRRCLVLVDRYPTVEFVAADEKSTGKMASIIKGRDGKQIPVGATLPPEFADLNVGAYNGVVKGPRASNGAAVICESQDFTTMAKHALIRNRFREARASTRKGKG